MHKLVLSFLLLLSMLTVLTGCQIVPQTTPLAGKLNVVVTTTLVGDIVRNVGGAAVDVIVLLPTGSDPHSFEPVPQDLARLEQADLIFANGAGLEEFLSRILEGAGATERLVSLSDGLDLITGDPHVWTDPTMVSSWVDKVEKALAEADPDDSARYQENAAAYRQALAELDEWIQAQVEQIPQGQRKLVTDHQTFAYFARRYGFDAVGAVIPSFSTLAEPSARELAELENTIRNLNVRAIFVDQAANPALSQRVSQDTGVRMVPVYSGSLSEPGGEAATYLDFMRYNTNAIVSALK